MNLTPLEKEDAYNRGLPKWPQMLVTGTPVTPEQAKEIIFATDSALTSTYGGCGNDRQYEAWFMGLTHYSRFDLKTPYFNSDALSEEERIKARELLQKCWDAASEFETRANFLRTEYVRNSWAISAFIFGPGGWMHPDGNIAFIDNVGKYPSVLELATEWSEISARWPFLDVWVTLMSGEGSEDGTRPVVTFHVHDGLVDTFEGTLQPFINKKVVRNFETEFDASSFGLDRSREHGLPRAWMVEFAEKVRPLVDEICDAAGLP